MPLFTYEINCSRDRTFEIQAKKKKPACSAMLGAIAALRPFKVDQLFEI